MINGRLTEDNKVMIWDLRINKRIMLCMDCTDKTKYLVKAKFLGSSHVVALYEN